MSFANIFSHFEGCLLVLLIVFFTVKKVFILSNSQYCILAFVSMPPMTCLVRSCWGQGQRGCCLCSQFLMVSYPTSRSFIHFAFIFVNGVRKWCSFILLHIAVQFSQHHLLKRLSFFHWIFCAAFSKICWPYNCESISGFSIPLFPIGIWSMFHWSMCLFLCQYHPILITTPL